MYIIVNLLILTRYCANCEPERVEHVQSFNVFKRELIPSIWVFIHVNAFYINNQCKYIQQKQSF